MSHHLDLSQRLLDLIQIAHRELIQLQRAQQELELRDLLRYLHAHTSKPCVAPKFLLTLIEMGNGGYGSEALE